MLVTCILSELDVHKKSQDMNLRVQLFRHFPVPGVLPAGDLTWQGHEWVNVLSELLSDPCWIRKQKLYKLMKARPGNSAICFW